MKESNEIEITKSLEIYKSIYELFEQIHDLIISLNYNNTRTNDSFINIFTFEFKKYDEYYLSVNFFCFTNCLDVLCSGFDNKIGLEQNAEILNYPSNIFVRLNIMDDYFAYCFQIVIHEKIYNLKAILINKKNKNKLFIQNECSWYKKEANKYVKVKDIFAKISEYNNLGPVHLIYEN